MSDQGWPVVIGGELESVYLKPGGDEEIICVSGLGRFTADEARALATALQAAADASDKLT